MRARGLIYMSRAIAARGGEVCERNNSKNTRPTSRTFSAHYVSNVFRHLEIIAGCLVLLALTDARAPPDEF